MTHTAEEVREFLVQPGGNTNQEIKMVGEKSRPLGGHTEYTTHIKGIRSEEGQALYATIETSGKQHLRSYTEIKRALGEPGSKRGGTRRRMPARWQTPQSDTPMGWEAEARRDESETSDDSASSATGSEGNTDSTGNGQTSGEESEDYSPCAREINSDTGD